VGPNLVLNVFQNPRWLKHIDEVVTSKETQSRQFTSMGLVHISIRNDTRYVCSYR